MGGGGGMCHRCHGGLSKGSYGLVLGALMETAGRVLRGRDGAGTTGPPR
jgi:hypothetical protein